MPERMAITSSALVAVVVVVPQDGDDRNVDVGELVGQGPGLLGGPDPGQVTGQEQEVGPVVQVLQMRPQGSGGVGGEMDVSGGGDPDHRSAPSSSGTSGGSGRLSRVVVALSIS